MKTRLKIQRLDKILAPTMFSLSVGFLIVIAAVLHLPEFTLVKQNLQIAVGVIALLYVAFLSELMLFFCVGARLRPIHFMACLFPFLRFACPDHVDGQRIWIPIAGWRQRNASFSDHVQQVVNGPMIVIALVVLPLILAELLWADKIADSVFWFATINVVTALIWIAFAFEFILLISLVEKKFQYCLRHWLDLLVILLPLTAIVRAVRVSQLVRLQKVSRTVRLFRVRGMAMRAWRAVLALDLLGIVFAKSEEDQLVALEKKLTVDRRELADLEMKIDNLRRHTAVSDLNRDTQDLCHANRQAGSIGTTTH